MNVGDRKEVLENAFEPDVFPVECGCVELQQRLECPGLNVQEVRHGHPLVELTERNLL